MSSIYMRHAKERLYGRLMIIFGIIIWGALAAGLVLAAISGGDLGAGRLRRSTFSMAF